MLKPAEMVRLTVGVHAAERDEMVAALHEAGAVELRSVADEERLRERVTPCHRSSGVPDIAAARSRLERTVEILAAFIPEKNTVVALFSRPPDTKISFLVTDTASALKEAARFSEITETIYSPCIPVILPQQNALDGWMRKRRCFPCCFRLASNPGGWGGRPY